MCVCARVCARLRACVRAGSPGLDGGLQLSEARSDAVALQKTGVCLWWIVTDGLSVSPVQNHGKSRANFQSRANLDGPFMDTVAL